MYLICGRDFRWFKELIYNYNKINTYINAPSLSLAGRPPPIHGPAKKRGILGGLEN